MTKDQVIEEHDVVTVIEIFTKYDLFGSIVTIAGGSQGTVIADADTDEPLIEFAQFGFTKYKEPILVNVPKANLF